VIAHFNKTSCNWLRHFNKGWVEIKFENPADCGLWPDSFEGEFKKENTIVDAIIREEFR
jgi:hypothetical protein